MPVPITDPGTGSTAYITINAALVWIMIPGLGLFYSGLSNSKNALTLCLICILALAITTIEWIIWGFSLSFSENGTSAFIGDFSLAGMSHLGNNAMALVAPGVPSISFALYQLMFASIAVAIIFGATTERVRLVPAMLFIFLWDTFVYSFVAYWTFSARGWIKNMACLSTTSNIPCALGGLDFAGGGPVHIASGFSGLAYCLMLGSRRRKPQFSDAPHNIINIYIGTALIWFGWFGFNGGSSVTATARGGMASFVTNTAASSAGLTWMLVDYMKTKKISLVGFCSGAVSGLVAITPAAGFVAPWSALIIGFLSGIICNYGCDVKRILGYDDSLDAFSVHGLGGFLGCILTGVFAQQWVASLDGTVISSGWVDGNFVQVGYQIAGSLAIAVWSFSISLILLFVINKIPGLHLRSTEEDEKEGCDYSEMREMAYNFKGMEFVEPLVSEKMIQNQEISLGETIV